MIDSNKQKRLARAGRHRRIRAKVAGTADRPRLSVFRSAGYIYAQLIDDAAGRTLAAADDLGKEAAKAVKKVAKEAGERKAKTAAAYAVGHLIAEKAKAKGISRAVFDRGGFAYAGRVAALAEGARDGGLEF